MTHNYNNKLLYIGFGSKRGTHTSVPGINIDAGLNKQQFFKDLITQLCELVGGVEQNSLSYNCVCCKVVTLLTQLE